MYWIITYVPLSEDIIRIKTTKVIGDNKQEAQKYFSRYYDGRIIGIEKKI